MVESSWPSYWPLVLSLRSSSTSSVLQVLPMVPQQHEVVQSLHLYGQGSRRSPSEGTMEDLTPGLYLIENAVNGPIGDGPPKEGSDDIPIVAAASPAIWSLTIVDPSAVPDGQTWNIFLTGGPPRKTASADNDDVGPAVTVINQQVVVPGSPSIIPDAWRITWFPKDRAYKIENFDGTCRWLLRDKYREGATDQEPVRCLANSDDDKGNDLWKLVRVPED